MTIEARTKSPGMAVRAYTPADLGLGGHPWPQFLDGRAAVVVPCCPERHPRDEDGWTSRAEELVLSETWSAQLNGDELTVLRPDGAQWLTASLPLTRDWRRAASVHRGVIVVTGQFTDITQFRSAAQAGHLSLVAVPISFAGRRW